MEFARVFYYAIYLHNSASLIYVSCLSYWILSLISDCVNICLFFRPADAAGYLASYLLQHRENSTNGVDPN